MDRGYLLIVSGPSSAGKGTIVKKVMEKAAADEKKIWLSISMTTRPKKKGEVDGESYIFTTRKHFLEVRDSGGLIESNRYGSKYYGTPREFVEQKLDEGYCVILEIDVNGARQVWEKYNDCATVFIMPPSLKVLEERIRARGRETEEEIAVRMGEVEREIGCADWYDYIIVNDELELAVEQMYAVIEAERCKCRRNAHLIPRLIAEKNAN